MEDVLGSSKKVIMDVKGGNNLMYLPIDKLMRSSENQSSSTQNRFITPPEKKQHLLILGEIPVIETERGEDNESESDYTRCFSSHSFHWLG